MKNGYIYPYPKKRQVIPNSNFVGIYCSIFFGGGCSRSGIMNSFIGPRWAIKLKKKQDWVGMATGYCRWREIMWNPVQFHSWSFIFHILWIGNSNSDREFTILEDCAPRPMWCWSPSSARSRSWRIISSSAPLFGAMQTCRKVKRGKTNASQYQVSTILKSYLWNWNWFCCVWNNVYLDPQMLGC